MIRGNAPLLRVISSLYPQSTNVPVLYAIMKYPIPVKATNMYIITSGVPFFSDTIFLLILDHFIERNFYKHWQYCLRIPPMYTSGRFFLLQFPFELICLYPSSTLVNFLSIYQHHHYH